MPGAAPHDPLVCGLVPNRVPPLYRMCVDCTQHVSIAIDGPSADIASYYINVALSAVPGDADIHQRSPAFA